MSSIPSVSSSGSIAEGQPASFVNASQNIITKVARESLKACVFITFFALQFPCTFAASVPDSDAPVDFEEDHTSLEVMVTLAVIAGVAGCLMGYDVHPEMNRKPKTE